MSFCLLRMNFYDLPNRCASTEIATTLTFSTNDVRTFIYIHIINIQNLKFKQKHNQSEPDIMRLKRQLNRTY